MCSKTSRNVGKIKTLPDKQKWREFIDNRLALRNIKGSSSGRKEATSHSNSNPHEKQSAGKDNCVVTIKTV